jgi:general nucleoside transport system permease protein
MKNPTRFLGGRFSVQFGGVSSILSPLIAVAAAFLVGGLVVLAIGENPLRIYAILFRGAFGSVDSIGLILFNAVPLIFAGLAVAFAFRAGLFNIGGEGQLYIGAFVCTLAGFALSGLPAVVMIPALIVASAAGGAAWAAIPGILKARFGVHEVINTIMMNFIAVGLTSYFVVNVLREAGQMTPQTAEIPVAGQLPRLSGALSHIGIHLPAANPLNYSLLLALGAIWLAWFVLYRTNLGYDIRAVGANPSAAEYAGINVRRTIVFAMLISGAFAGLVATNEVMGFRHRFLDNFSAGWGFMGIAVALLGKNTPVGVLLAALLFGILTTGGLEIDVFTDVPRELILVVQAVTIILVVVGNEIAARARQGGRTREETVTQSEGEGGAGV